MRYIVKCWQTPVHIVRHVSQMALHPVRTILARMHRFWHPKIGKRVRHYIRHHWGLSHHAARTVYHGTLLTCTLVAVGGAGMMVLPRLPDIPFRPRPLEHHIHVVDVPEPSTLPLLGAGIIFLIGIRK